MSRRLYLGRLNPAARREEIEDHFKGYGKIVDVRAMGNFAFVEFDSARDAEDVMRDFNHKPFMGEDLIIEPAREARRRDPYDPYSRGPPPRSAAPRRGFRINVGGVPGSTSWQDLKDFGRLGCNSVIYADLDRSNPGVGIIEYPSMVDAEDAMKRLEGVDINGQQVTLELIGETSGGGGGGGGGYDDRRAPPPRDYRDRAPRYDDRRRYDDRYESRDYDRRDRYDDRAPRRDDRYDDRPARRDDRDRSPPRRDDRDRSPPRREDRVRSPRRDDGDRSPPRRERRDDDRDAR